MSKGLFGEASKFRNKKQKARRKKKMEKEKLEGKSLDIRDFHSFHIFIQLQSMRYYK